MKYYFLFPIGVEALPLLMRLSREPDTWAGFPPMNVMGPFRTRKAAEAWFKGGEPPLGAFMHVHEAEARPTKTYH